MKSSLLFLAIATLSISWIGAYGQPINDDYSGAISIAINLPVSGTTIGATKSSEPAINDSEGHHDDDVWFKFVAMGDDYTLSISDYSTSLGSVKECFIELFEDNEHGQLGARIGSKSYTQFMWSFDVVDLNDGATYFVRIYTPGREARASFNVHLTITEPPLNDDCEQAYDLDPLDLPWGTLTLSGATESLPEASCTTKPVKDTWFWALPRLDGDFSVSGRGYEFDIVFDVYKGECGDLELVASCVNDFGVGMIENFSLSKVRAGEKYYMRVYRMPASEQFVSGGFFMGAYGTSFPVKLSSFAVVSGEYGAVVLNWETTEEANSSHFQIQHSVDGKEWADIGQVPASRTSDFLKKYTFRHPTPNLFSTNYYRLEMVDQDDTSAFSEIVSWKHSPKDNSAQPLNVFPNPVSDWLQLEASDNKYAPIAQIVDTRGAIRSVAVGADHRVDVRHLASGVYILTVAGGAEGSRSYRFVVVR